MNENNLSRERIMGLAVSENGFLFDTWTGSTYSMNRTGAIILRALQDEMTLDDIAVKLADEFDVDRDTARTDIQHFIEQLFDLKILEHEVERD